MRFDAVGSAMLGNDLDERQHRCGADRVRQRITRVVGTAALRLLAHHQRLAGAPGATPGLELRVLRRWRGGEPDQSRATPDVNASKMIRCGRGSGPRPSS